MPIADPLNLVQFEDQSIQNYFDSYKGEISDAPERGGAGLGMVNLGGKGSGKAQSVVACEREWSYKVLLMYVIAGFLFELWLKYHRESLDTYNGGDERLHKDIKNNTTDNTVLLTDLPTDHQDSFGNTHQGQALVKSIRETLEKFESDGRRWEISTFMGGGKIRSKINLVYKLDDYDETLKKIYDYQQQLVKIIYEKSSNIGLEQLKIDELCKKIKE